MSHRKKDKKTVEKPEDQTPMVEPQRVKVSWKYEFLLKEPNGEAEVVALYPKDTEFLLLSKTDDNAWYYVQSLIQSSKIGYVRADHVQII